MVHANTQRFVDDWRARRACRRLPRRRDLDPTLFGRLAPQLFMLGTTTDGREAFRLAGGLLADLHGRDLAGAEFASLWAPAARLNVTRALTHARRACTPVLLTADASAPLGPAVAVEFVLCPVTGPGGRPDRTFGLYQPLAPLAALLGRVVASHALMAVEPLDERPSPALKLITLDGRRVA